MTKPAKITASLLLGVSVVAGWVYLPFMRGVAAALRDHHRGGHRLYEVGCVIGPSEPRDPLAFRYQELLRQRYSISCEGIGGFAPTDETFKFVLGNNATTIFLVRRRLDTHFLANTYEEAKHDVTVRPATFRGCLADHELTIGNGERIVVWAQAPVTEAQLEAAESAAVVLRGQLTEVRAGGWNKRFGRRLEADALEVDPAGTCPKGTAQ